MIAPWVLPSEVAALLGGVLVAGYSDWRAREVSDRLWQVLGLIGLLLGGAAIAGESGLGLSLWLVVGAFALSHFFPWDERISRRSPATAWGIEVASYVLGSGLVVALSVTYGLGSPSVPWNAVVVLACVLGARGLFEARLLWGGADAKALMAIALLLPTFGAVVGPTPAGLAGWLAYSPFALTALVNGAMFTLAVPAFLFARNARRGEPSRFRSFVAYSIPVDEISTSFVWVHDPRWPAPEIADSAAEDAVNRKETARALKGAGFARVWVSPQLPWLAFLAAGAVAGLVAGNLLVDLIALA